MKLFQINEQDLRRLEEILPELMDFASMGCNDPCVRVRWRDAKDIMSNVRWNYGPYEEVQQINAE